jgi:hypothetical protein
MTVAEIFATASLKKNLVKMVVIFKWWVQPLGQPPEIKCQHQIP